jgi:hypothetical protein
MTGIGPSQVLKDLIVKSSQDNVITEAEAKDIEKGLKTEIEQGTLSETEAQEYMNEAKTFIDAEFEKTNAKFSVNVTDGSCDFNPTFLSFTITAKSDKKDGEGVKVKVTDFDNIEKDKQYVTLKADKENYLKYDKSGNVTGVRVARNVTTKPEDLGINTKLSEVIKADFTKNGNIDEIFPNTEEGAKKFLEALKKLPGNESNPPTLQDAKDLLNFIHTGTDGKGTRPTPVNQDGSLGKPPGPVQRLQILLEKCCGTMGEDIRGKNTPKGGDDHYGYATTLQIRALSAELSTGNQPGDVNLSETARVQDRNPDPENYTLAVILKDISPSTDNMRRHQTEQLKNNTARYGTVKERDFHNEKGPDKESAVVASLDAFNEPAFQNLKEGDTALISSFVDTNDSTSWADIQALKNKVDEYAAKGIRVDVRFTFGNVEIDLNDIQMSNLKNPANDIENVEWAEIAMPKFQAMSAKDLAKSYSLVEEGSNKGMKDLLQDKLDIMTDRELKTLFDDLKADTSFDPAKRKIIYGMIRDTMRTNADPSFSNGRIDRVTRE